MSVIVPSVPANSYNPETGSSGVPIGLNDRFGLGFIKSIYLNPLLPRKTLVFAPWFQTYEFGPISALFELRNHGSLETSWTWSYESDQLSSDKLNMRIGYGRHGNNFNVYTRMGPNCMVAERSEPYTSPLMNLRQYVSGNPLRFTTSANLLNIRGIEPVSPDAGTSSGLYRYLMLCEVREESLGYKVRNRLYND